MNRQLNRGIFVFFLFFSIINTAHSQNKEFKKVNNVGLNHVLNNLRKTYELETANIFVRVYIVGNKSGSAKQPESDEVTNNIYVAISEIGENPRQSLFVWKDIFGDSDFTISKGSNNRVILSFFYLKGATKHKVTVDVTMDGILTHH